MRSLIVINAGLSAGDAISTYQALHRPGVIEGNAAWRPVTGTSASLAAFTCGRIVLQSWMLDRLGRKNKTAAIATGIALAVAQGWIVNHNMRAGR